MIEIGTKVKDLIGDFDSGVVIDKYTNQYTESGPATMYVVDFGDDQIFDRFFYEISKIETKV